MSARLFSREHNQAVARRIREAHGIEMTPDQVAAERRSAYAKIRAELARRGDPDPPPTDEELYVMIHLASEGGRLGLMPAQSPPRVTLLCQTCTGLPAQWLGQLADGRTVHLRYDPGVLSVGFAADARAATLAALCTPELRRVGLSYEPGEVPTRADLARLTAGVLDWSELVPHGF